MKQDYVFKWSCSSGVTTLTLHNRTKEEAMKIALEMGYVPVSRWKPRTWHNFWYAFITDDRKKD